MNCPQCNTKLTKYNATKVRNVHDLGNCAQILMIQRDDARTRIAALEARLASAERVVRTTRKAADGWTMVARFDGVRLALQHYDAAYPDAARETE